MNISYKLYGFLLLAYPPEFRQRFADEMLQVFRDSYAHETSRRSLPGLLFFLPARTIRGSIWPQL